MIQNTFLFIPGIGQVTEEVLWKNGVINWNDFISAVSHPDSDKIKWGIIKDYIIKAQDALDKKDATFFASHLPQNEYWRLVSRLYRHQVLDCSSLCHKQDVDALRTNIEI